MTDRRRGEQGKTPHIVRPLAKKPYRKPALAKLGTLRELTTQHGSARSDGARFSRTGRGGRNGGGGRPQVR